ncbi:2Fe-2S iron-sulfur cluster-binding protein [Mycolicibacterium llatzerense]|uniref:2Fe-2S iron-sulfur cluster-binding protein n=1 Tax=Mycolicibacterium llatzerense TaxID=280871 RepID=UPI0021B4E40D|nr:2Fe-2S iron-sulfur cluster binding domain-containing protein [Mycolicibacterium llatzerense]MCT7365859.1 hypothetical protein [Mycolicibacterium llatzerense]
MFLARQPLRLIDTRHAAEHTDKSSLVAAGESRRTFEVELRETGIIVEIPAGTTILDAVTRHGVVVPYSCRRGVCGTCETTVLAGEIDHRDLVLARAERTESNSLMICVSRAAAGCERIALKL